MEFLSAATDSVLSSAIEVGIGIVGFTGVIVTQASSKPLVSQSPIVPISLMSLSISLGYFSLNAILQLPQDR